MRGLTIVNLALWVVLAGAWIPYTLAAGWMDPTSVEVRWILTLTAGMQIALFGLRAARRRPVLG
ncbi:MAG TPA: hypothetical protein VMP38_03175 [Candidatus Acidoferrum sp.]|nr:hypothetical protein [Candidatus Acidoferrum sp.]